MPTSKTPDNTFYWSAHVKQYAAFYIPYSLFVIKMGVMLLINSKADLHLWLSSFHTPTLDLFFKYYTEVGGSIPYIALAGILFYRYRMALFVLATQLISGLFSTIIKHTVTESRPLKYFADNYPSIELHRVEGVHMNVLHSFPSGHTITAFAFFLSLAFFTKRPILQVVYFILAALVGYSRIYLSQHFAMDVLAGSIIGVMVTILLKPHLDKLTESWGEKSLANVFSRKKK